MTSILFPKIAQWWNYWAGQSVKFVQQYVGDKQNDLDEPFLRSNYILLSYAFELMIKSRLVAVLVAVSNITEMQLKNNYRHEIGKILSKLKSLDELEKIGIKGFQENKRDFTYIIETTQGEKFNIDDFTAIRYKPKNKRPWDEHSIIYDTTKIMLGISKRIHKLNKIN